ncbi:4'-phosphopantetheinyl transferase superfamily protein [Streptomyces sp. ACA25]|uniref:4'-phosphopantetheinyl transferase family protein n=1 Tax=Streptomyces sp. ACA25 TaxID=3022596 RepID=UPI00230731FE|nr:4'-phosphopantetheinyl transferase superfamily protein [Streptomyces sp. ACA25]MDB1089571.1 4'-phosphopantetheinyl transferase superfamily protein [Streptomyces sp. ACA25]
MPGPHVGIPEPLPTGTPGQLGHGVRAALATSGTAVVHGSLDAWLPGPGRTGPALRRLLGRDWQRYQRIPLPRMRERFAASRLLLRHVAGAAIDAAPESVDLSYQPGGRPYVRGCDQIDVSLSHTDEMLVVGVTRRGRIGVDVERRARRMAGTGSESQTCTPFERARLDPVDMRVRNDTLVRLWTLKEAYTKALGQGLRLRFTEFGFALRADGACLTGPAGEPAGEPDWSFGTFHLPGDYVVGAAVHDAGLGAGSDLSTLTALDEGMLDALLGAASTSGDPAGFLRDADRVDPVTGMQFGHDGGKVIPHRSLGEV